MTAGRSSRRWRAILSASLIPGIAVLIAASPDVPIGDWRLQVDWPSGRADVTLTITEKDDVQRQLEEFVSFRGPAFLEVMVDPTAHVYPMVGPGLPYRDMITGDFIPNRYRNAKPAEPDQSEMF